MQFCDLAARCEMPRHIRRVRRGTKTQVSFSHQHALFFAVSKAYSVARVGHERDFARLRPIARFGSWHSARIQSTLNGSYKPVLFGLSAGRMIRLEQDHSGVIRYHHRGYRA